MNQYVTLPQKLARKMSNNKNCPAVGPEVKGWIILKNGDDGFNSEENYNQPYYYHPEFKFYWRRNVMGWGPPLQPSESEPINQTNKISKPLFIITPKCYNKDEGETLTGLWHPTTMIREIDDMIKTINRLELWEWIRDQNPPESKGYMFWDHENVKAISEGLENNNHSGFSFSMCMRQIQYIAKNDWETWNERNAQWNAEREAKKALEKINQTDPGAHLSN